MRIRQRTARIRPAPGAEHGDIQVWTAKLPTLSIVSMSPNRHVLLGDRELGYVRSTPSAELGLFGTGFVLDLMWRGPRLAGPMTRPVSILIDPFACTVTDIELDPIDLANLHRTLSHEVHPVRSHALAYCHFLRVGEAIHVDKQGSLESPVRHFKMAGLEPPLAGKGLILGTDGGGNTISASSSLALIVAAVTFAEMRDGRIIQTYQPWKREAV